MTERGEALERFLLDGVEADAAVRCTRGVAGTDVAGRALDTCCCCIVTLALTDAKRTIQQLVNFAKGPANDQMSYNANVRKSYFLSNNELLKCGAAIQEASKQTRVCGKGRENKASVAKGQRKNKQRLRSEAQHADEKWFRRDPYIPRLMKSMNSVFLHNGQKT